MMVEAETFTGAVLILRSFRNRLARIYKGELAWYAMGDNGVVVAVRQ